MNMTILNGAFEHPADGWYQVEALGEHPHHGAGIVQVIDAAAAESIVGRFNADAAAGRLRHGHEMLIDHEHFSDQPDQETRAYGWLQELQQRLDGIYGRIRWTSTGKAAVDGGDYRFFSTEYEPGDLTILNGGCQAQGSRKMRPTRLAGLTVTNMNNNRGQKPITNRAGVAVPFEDAAENNFAGSGEPVERRETTSDGRGSPLQMERESMKSVKTLLGLPAEADEAAVHAAVAKLLNRGEAAPEALAALRAEREALAAENGQLLSEQSDTLLDACGVRDDRLRNRLKDGLKLLKNRPERLAYLADFGLQPGEVKAGTAGRVLNRGTGTGRESVTGAGTDGEEATAIRIQNRASELRAKGLKYDAAWNQARREVAGKV